MKTHRRAIAAVALSVLFLSATHAQDQLVRFRDSTVGLWGYKRPDGRVAIPPRYLGAGVFRGGQAPVKDASGFAIADGTGRILERIATDSVPQSERPVPPPADACAWTAPTAFPSTGLACYVRQLRGSARAIGGDIAINPKPGESFRAAVAWRFSNGAVVVEDISYEGLRRRVLLPGVSADDVRQWRLKLYPDLPVKTGCSESWSAGVVPGGAFIEQTAGC